MDRPKDAYRGTGYWVGQFVLLALFGVACLGGGLFILFAPESATCPRGGCEREPGAGVMLLLAGVAFLIVLLWMVGRYRGSSAEQRAVYAWVIMQRHTPGHHSRDRESMALAARARRGELTRQEIARLQALRPEVPYPGKLPPA